MGERRILIVINPPEQGRCFTGVTVDAYATCMHMGCSGECDLGFRCGGWDLPDRPAVCIAAESDAERVEDALEWYEFSKVGPADTEKRDRVADALAAVPGPEPVEL